MTAAELRAKHDLVRIKRGQQVQSLAAMKIAIEDAAVADALGETYVGDHFTAADLAEAESKLLGFDRALEALAKQIPAAEAEEERASTARRLAQAQHIRDVIAPPLREAAEAAGEAFGRALAALAAAEDTALRLRRRPEQAYIPGQAASLMAAMSKTSGQKTFTDTGAGRGAWDWVGYAEQSQLIEAELQEVGA